MKYSLSNQVVDYLEQKGIATRETLKIFVATALFYLFSLAALHSHNLLLDWAFSLMVMGGMANLYVISFNDNKMPVPVDPETLAAMRERWPERGICQLTDKTNLAWLSDKYLVGLGRWNFGYASIGDFAI